MAKVFVLLKEFDKNFYQYSMQLCEYMNKLLLFIFFTFDFGGCRGAESFWCKSFLVGCISTGGVIIVIIIRLATFPDCHHHHLISPISTCVTLWWPSSWSSSSQYAVHNVYTLCSVLDIPRKYVLHWWPRYFLSSYGRSTRKLWPNTMSFLRIRNCL